MSNLTQSGNTDKSNLTPVSLGEALRALPPFAPQASAWPELAAKLAKERGIAATAHKIRQRRYAWPTGIAAALLLAFSTATVFRTQHEPNRDSAAQSAATKPDGGASLVHNAANSTNSHESTSARTDDLAALQTRSRALEQWLRDTSRASTPQSAQDLAASTEIEDMIGFVDVQLDAADPADASATLSLWLRRVSLLEDLSTLRYSANLMNFRDGLATANSGAAASWKN